MMTIKNVYGQWKLYLVQNEQSIVNLSACFLCMIRVEFFICEPITILFSWKGDNTIVSFELKENILPLESSK